MTQKEEFSAHVWTIKVKSDESLVAIEQQTDDNDEPDFVYVSTCQIDLLISLLKQAKKYALAWESNHGGSDE